MTVQGRYELAGWRDGSELRAMGVSENERFSCKTVSLHYIRFVGLFILKILTFTLLKPHFGFR